MANREHYQEILARFIGGFSSFEREMLNALARGLGVDFLHPDFAKADPATIALHWELAMRWNPLLQDEAFGEGEFSRYCNPFFAPDVVEEKYWVQFVHKPQLSEGEALLAAAYKIENSADWPSAAVAAKHYRETASQVGNDEAHDVVGELQEYLSRVILRGEQEGIIVALQAHFGLVADAAGKTRSAFSAMDYFVDDILPMMAYAYTRVRNSDPGPLLSLYRATANRFVAIIEEASEREELKSPRANEEAENVFSRRMKELRSLRDRGLLPLTRYVVARDLLAGFEAIPDRSEP